MYEVVALENEGESEPLENESADNVESDDAVDRVISVEYVIVVESSAVTRTSTVFAPTANETDDVPDTSVENPPDVPSRYSTVAPAFDFVAEIMTDVVL